MLDITKLLAFLLGVIASSFISIYFLKEFIEVRHYQRLLRALAFILFFVASVLALKLGSPNDYSVPITALGLVVFYVSLVFDKHSHLRYTVFLPFLSLFFFKGHQLLLVLSILDAVALLELAYSKEHQRLIPFVSAFILVGIAEYFTVFGPALNTDSAIAPVLYIFTAFIFLLWILFYLIRKSFRLFKNED